MKKSLFMKTGFIGTAMMLTASTVMASDGYASMEEFAASAEYVKFMIDNLWILLAAAMVFIMHLGFASVESGMTQAKNSVNVIYKNVFILCTGILTYAIVGFQIMYPGDFNGIFGFGGFGIGFDGSDPVSFLSPAYGEDMTIWSDFIFQAMFAATAATIVSGCVTGRIKLHAFMIFGVILVALIYPMTGSWVWGGGWLDDLGFYDFAGSTLVHGVGGIAGLACIILLGARKGKYNGKVNLIPGHNIPLATAGVFLLWFGWFGFNGGSVLSANPAEVSYVFVNTALGASSGAVAAMLITYLYLKTLDAPMALNGILGGLVAVTAGADVVAPLSAALMGGVGGIIVVFAMIGLDKLKLDDPVGAVSVHGIVGIWGTLAVGIFSTASTFVTQLIGVLAIYGSVFLLSFLVFAAIKYTIGVRVSEAVEDAGLDISEHGVSAYPNFQGQESFDAGPPIANPAAS